MWSRTFLKGLDSDDNTTNFALHYRCAAGTWLEWINYTSIACVPEEGCSNDYMGSVKRKGVFEHVQNAQIKIQPAHVQSLIRAFALHSYIL